MEFDHSYNFGILECNLVDFFMLEKPAAWKLVATIASIAIIAVVYGMVAISRPGQIAATTSQSHFGMDATADMQSNNLLTGCVLRTPGIAEPASRYNEYVREHCGIGN